jgi:hypothetical protein
MRRLFLTALTGRDNVSIDIGRVVWSGLSVALAAFEGHAVIWLHQPFDPVAFATGAGAILAAGGAAIGMKAHAEPGAN